MVSMIASAKPNVLTIFKQAFTKWSDDNALRLGAALAYYSSGEMREYEIYLPTTDNGGRPVDPTVVATTKSTLTQFLF